MRCRGKWNISCDYLSHYFRLSREVHCMKWRILSIMAQPARIIYQNSGMKPFIRLYRAEFCNFNPWLINGLVWFWDRSSCGPCCPYLPHHWAEVTVHATIPQYLMPEIKPRALCMLDKHYRNSYIFSHHIYLFWDRVFPGCPECPWICDPLSSAFGVLGLQDVQFYPWHQWVLISLRSTKNKTRKELGRNVYFRYVYWSWNGSDVFLSVNSTTL